MPEICDRHPTARAADLWYTLDADLNPLTLMFCGHDTTTHGPALRAQGWHQMNLSPPEHQTKAEMDRQYTDELQREWDNR